jgi:hypothetical protein
MYFQCKLNGAFEERIRSLNYINQRLQKIKCLPEHYLGRFYDKQSDQLYNDVPSEEIITSKCITILQFMDWDKQMIDLYKKRQNLKGKEEELFNYEIKHYSNIAKQKHGKYFELFWRE